jgi:hypothetical protein
LAPNPAIANNNRARVDDAEAGMIMPMSFA